MKKMCQEKDYIEVELIDEKEVFCKKCGRVTDDKKKVCSPSEGGKKVESKEGSEEKIVKEVEEKKQPKEKNSKKEELDECCKKVKKLKVDEFRAIIKEEVREALEEYFKEKGEK